MTYVRAGLTSLLLLAAVTGCSDETPLSGPPQEAGTTRYQTPPLSLPPGEEIIFCVAIDRLDKARAVRSAKGFQQLGGHHTSLLYGKSYPQAVGEVWECSEADMMSTSYVAGGNAVYNASDPYGHTGTRFPEGFGLEVPAGALLIMQSHYVNYSDQPREVQDILDVGFSNESLELLGSFSAGTANFVIPALGHQEADASCTFDEPTNFFALSGHTHKLGSRFTIHHTRDGMTQEIYHETNGAELEVDSPDIETFPDGAPLHMLPGDKLDVHCEWDNIHDHDVAFPEEMCGLQSHYWPNRGDILCAGEVSLLNCGGEACNAGEVCCVSDIGQGHCSTAEACDTSYTCNIDSDCKSGQLCCTVPVVGQVCLSEDTCPGRTPCPPPGEECGQISEFLPIVCCESTGVCDLETKCM